MTKQKLDKRILLRRITRLTGPKGRRMDIWSCCESVDGRIDRPQGQELEKARAFHPEATAVLTIESLHGTAEGWRAVWRNTVFSILAVQPGLEVETTVLYCCET